MTVVFKENPKGIVELLRSPGVRADLERRASKVAAAASDTDPGENPEPLTYEMRSDVGTHRARAAAIAAGARTNAHERSEHVLVKVLDAAR